ncbi:hypothetical protein CTI12_AA122390 [Artemisia annua]|uniref:Uncharacterized protein n=1 Tax=Artemisia annua TaxID=35608 RepID=A0A2U1PQ32_ARTAN|nr:hypothetical protein CTI12_AA122390 [Artemisia annua]
MALSWSGGVEFNKEFSFTNILGSGGLRYPDGPINPKSILLHLRAYVRFVFVVFALIPLLPSPEAAPYFHNIASSFYLEKSDLKALLTPECFYTPQAYLEIVVFTSRKGSQCGVGIKRQQVGTFNLNLGPEWGEGKPVILFSGWIGIVKMKQEAMNFKTELLLRVKLDPGPQYVFQFEDETKLSPQVDKLPPSKARLSQYSLLASAGFEASIYSSLYPWGDHREKYKMEQVKEISAIKI